MTDPLGNTTTLIYDPLDRVTQITDAKSGMTGFGYDPNNNLTSVTDANQNQTIYTYFPRNQRQTRQDALLVQESYLYDPNGNLNQFTDRKGQVTKYQYDGINRRNFTGFGWNGSTYGSTINYNWDGGDRLHQAVDSANGTITRTYDGLDRLTQEQTPLGTVGYTFDNANRRCTMAVTPTGTGQTTVNYSYIWDNANRLGDIYLGSNGCSSTGTAAVGITYDSSNRRQQLTLPNGVTVAYGYDLDSRVNALTYSKGMTQLGTLSYTYDDAGRRLTTGGTLAAVTLPANVAGGSSTTYNADNEQTAFSGTTLSFDANGNLTGDGTYTYIYGSRNQLNQIKQGGTVVESIGYDGLGRRQAKITGTATQYLYDGWNPVQELNTANPPAPTGNLLTGLKVDEYFSRTDSSGNVSSFLRDALGSTVGLVGSAGTIATSYTYQPFGATTVSGASNGNV